MPSHSFTKMLSLAAAASVGGLPIVAGGTTDSQGASYVGAPSRDQRGPVGPAAWRRPRQPDGPRLRSQLVHHRRRRRHLSHRRRLRARFHRGPARCGSLSGGTFELGGGFWYGAIPNATCYANCDQSTNTPILNVNDYVCFNNRFAAGDSYANCDQSTNVPSSTSTTTSASTTASPRVARRESTGRAFLSREHDSPRRCE
jgi:hypothetical protein